MKKFMITTAALIFTIPAFASCPLTGFCAPASSSLSTVNLQEKYAPDNLSRMQKPDSFMPQYRQPYNNMLINTEQETASTQRNPLTNTESSSYNSNCQFGICLPGAGVEEELMP